MNRDEILRLMSDWFGTRMIDLIAESYHIRARAHNAAIGDNAMTFGTNVRFTVERLLEDALQETPGLVVSRPVGSFQIAYMGHVFHFYKYGMDMSDDIDELSFDDSTTKMNLVNDNQLSLPGISELRHWVVAHCGNPEQGLVEVYIGAPHALGGHRSPWAWRHQIYALYEQLGFDAIEPGFFHYGAVPSVS